MKKNQVEFVITVDVLDYEKKALASRTARLIIPIGGEGLEDAMAALNVHHEAVKLLAAQVADMAVFKASQPIEEAMKAASEQEHDALPEMPDPGPDCIPPELLG